MSLDPHIKGYFWDIDPQKASPQKHPKYYATRILENGDNKAVSWLFKTFGEQNVKKMLPEMWLSDRSKNYWSQYFSRHN